MSDFDAIVVGAGCAGSVAAYTLASAGKSVLVVERGQYAGAKNMTGGRIYTHSLAKVFPNYQEAPLQRKVTHERISLMSPDSNFTIDYAARELEEAGKESYTVLRGPFDQWLAEQAENAGAEFIYGIAVEDLIIEDGKVKGILAFGDEITSDVVILADGVNSLLTSKAGLSKKDAEKALKAFTDVVAEELKKDGKVQLVGFGTFEVSSRAAREGRNPQSGKPMKIAASKAPKFKAGKALKDMLNA